MQRALIGAGVAIVVLGIVFHMQGQSIVGPESSFMYSNPDWITYGLQISIIGSIILGIGIAIMLIRKFQ